MHARRDHGGIYFIDLRDRYGRTQVVLSEEVHELGGGLVRSEAEPLGLQSVDVGQHFLGIRLPGQVA
ncbi:MAG: hypothetical protein R3351_00795 [Nitrospirales bacterium]|nr:hypothetical protein [Nitrospirales bacterium]